MLLFQNRKHKQSTILLVLLNGPAAANTSVNNLPSIILRVHKIVLRGVNEQTESEHLFPPHSATLGNKLHSTSSKYCVIINCLFGFQLPHTHHITHQPSELRHPRICSFPLTGSAADQSTSSCRSGTGVRHTTVRCTSHVKSYPKLDKTRAKSNHCHKNTKYPADFCHPHKPF